MPIKFRPTDVTIARGTGKKSVTHYYMKNTPLKELIDEWNKIKGTKGKGKLRQKIENEFVRRGKVGIPTAVLNPIVEETDDLLASTR